MLPKEQRFSFKNSLPRKTFNSQSFSVRYGQNSKGPKVAVVVSKRIDKRASVRNKIKRQILELVRVNIKTEDQLDIIFYAKKSIVENNNLEKEIIDTLEFIKHA